MATKQQFAEAANAFDLMIAECGGQNVGIGSLEELEGQIADGILPEETTLREARSDDF